MQEWMRRGKRKEADETKKRDTEEEKRWGLEEERQQRRGVRSRRQTGVAGRSRCLLCSRLSLCSLSFSHTVSRSKSPTAERWEKSHFSRAETLPPPPHRATPALGPGLGAGQRRPSATHR